MPRAYEARSSLAGGLEKSLSAIPRIPTSIPTPTYKKVSSFGRVSGWHLLSRLLGLVFYLPTLVLGWGGLLVAAFFSLRSSSPLVPAIGGPRFCSYLCLDCLPSFFSRFLLKFWFRENGELIDDIERYFCGFYVDGS
jgi:hypothetical protein